MARSSPSSSPLENPAESLEGPIRYEDLLALLELFLLDRGDPVLQLSPDKVDELLLKGHHSSAKGDYLIDSPRVLYHVVVIDRVELDKDVVGEHGLNYVGKASLPILPQLQLWVEHVVTPR